MRRLAIAMTLAATMLGGLIIATPAQAAPRAEQYVAIANRGDVLRGWFWVDQIEGIIGCAKCVHWFDLKISEVVKPEQEAAINTEVIAGLTALSQASVATDPRTAAKLRADALAQFTTAARNLGATTAAAGDVGYFDPDKGVTVVAAAPWLSAADKDIVGGLTLLQRSFTDPEPAPWRQRAAQQFDKAFKEISTKQAIG
jgi:hypothetical protein